MRTLLAKGIPRNNAQDMLRCGIVGRLLLKTIFLFLIPALTTVRAETIQPRLATGPDSYDFVLRHGTIVDGTGNPSFHADIAVKDGRIAVVGKVAGVASREFDATNLTIAPGFIDVHTHA